VERQHSFVLPRASGLRKSLNSLLTISSIQLESMSCSFRTPTNHDPADVIAQRNRAEPSCCEQTALRTCARQARATLAEPTSVNARQGRKALNPPQSSVR
jgi:hypothetical protein